MSYQQINVSSSPGNSGFFRLWGDNSLITSLTGWHLEYDIEQGLRATCEWFIKTANLSKFKADIYNL